MMKWYGPLLALHGNNTKYKKKRNFQKIKFSKIYTPFNINTTFARINFHFPFIWQILIFESLPPQIAPSPVTSPNSWNIFAFSKTYFFILPLPHYVYNINFNLQTNSLFLDFIYRNNFYSLFWTLFRRVFFQFTRTFFKKIKFKGKGYYSYRNSRNVFALQFGYSHIIRLYFYFVHAKFLAKTSILLFGINALNLTIAGFRFFYVRPINIFTSRGIRFSRQIVYKKTGKISSYR